MKRIILSLSLVIATTTEFSQVKFSLGVRLGANYSQITNSELDAKTGLYAGLFTDFRFTSFYALQPEVTYSNQGGKSNTDGIGELDIHYVSIGVANKFYIFKDSGLHFIVGPSIDVNFEANVISLINDDGELEITPFDVTLFGGIGYEFPFGLSVEARYKHGFFDLDAASGEWDVYGNYHDDEDLLNSVIQIGATYKFDF
ncbi:porin family protein [Winogradskyella forsetii]|uniref:porin family protein n=1 Tax=Winogradskyella forsetii TaxID=2686077 RepID=UPI0015C96ACD|nr:porin family protein [Winogradskyella forsetii]